MTNPFDPAAIAPETLAFNARLAATLADLPLPMDLPVEVTRQAREEGRSIFELAGPREGSDWQEIGAGRRVRVSLPDGAGAAAPRGSYLHIHGGGWTFNAPHHYDAWSQRIARGASVRVISVEYRLAPEHVWPAQREDCMAAAEWVLGAFDGPVVVGGESAGAHLALVTALGLRDSGQGTRLTGMVLTYGAFDMRGTPSMRNWGPHYLVLSTPVVDWFARGMLGGHPAEDPDVSPLLADLAGLPPALLQVGTADPLLDDSLFLDARLRAAGGGSALVVVPGGVHGFDQFDLAIAREAHARVDAFIAARVG